MSWNPLRIFRRSPEAEPTAAQGFVDQLRELAQDLVTLEVNTIVKENMTAERMPSLPNALLDVAREYMRVFSVLRADIGAFFPWAERQDEAWKAIQVKLVDPGVAYDFPRLPDPVSFGHLFECLRWGAQNTRRALAGASQRPTMDQLLLLERIESNCDTLRTLLDRYPVLRDAEVRAAEIRAERAIFIDPKTRQTVRPSARDVLIVRKIWDVGVEEVVAQTAIQLDGDVVSRLSPRVAYDPERATQLLALHQQGVDTAVGNWRALFEAARAILGGLLGRPRDAAPPPDG
jgi:hypothetical protein